jgi:hypothetical protein
MTHRADWTMLAISFATGDGLSPVQLQKVLFLLGKELPNEVGRDFYEFIPYNYGPFDRSVYDDARALASQGLASKNDSSQGFWSYSATPAGLDHADKVKRSASQKAVSYLEKIVPWAQSRSFASLVRAIYQKYPEYRENSVFQG